MSKYIGNCSHIIDWDSIIDGLKDMEPAYVGPRHKGTDNIIGISDIQKNGPVS